MPQLRSRDFIKAELRKIAKNPEASFRQRLDALDRLAMIDKVYVVELIPQGFGRTAKLTPEEPITVAPPLAETDEGAELLKQFNEKFYNKGENVERTGS